MKKTLWGSRIAALACVGAMGACGDDTTIVELTVIETIPVDFDRMDGGVGEGAIIALDDLRDEPAYVEAAPSLRCGTVNREKSFIKVEALQVAAGATVLDYQVGVAARGSENFASLVRFNGSITNLDRIALTDSRVAFDPGGLGVVSQVVLSDAPALAVQVSATVPGALDRLQVAISLAIDFSSDAKGCP